MEIQKINSHKWEIVWHENMPYYARQEFKTKKYAQQHLSLFPRGADGNPRLYTESEIIERAKHKFPKNVVATEIIKKDHKHYIVGYVDIAHQRHEYDDTSTANNAYLYISNSHKFPSYAIDIRGGEYRHEDNLYPVLYDLKGNNSAIIRARKMGINIEEKYEYRGKWKYNLGYNVSAVDYIRIKDTYKIKPKKYTKSIAVKIAQWLTDDYEDQLEIENTIEHNRSTGGSACTAISQAYRDRDREWANELLDRAESAENRHRNTPYEEYLHSGIDRETAREMCRH